MQVRTLLGLHSSPSLKTPTMWKLDVEARADYILAAVLDSKGENRGAVKLDNVHQLGLMTEWIDNLNLDLHRREQERLENSSPNIG